MKKSTAIAFYLTTTAAFTAVSAQAATNEIVPTCTVEINGNVLYNGQGAFAISLQDGPTDPSNTFQVFWFGAAAGHPSCLTAFNSAVKAAQQMLIQYNCPYVGGITYGFTPDNPNTFCSLAKQPASLTNN